MEGFPLLLVVGLGEMQAYLEKLVDDLKLNDVVKFRFEFIPEEERIAHYAACDVAVFPKPVRTLWNSCSRSHEYGKTRSGRSHRCQRNEGVRNFRGS